MSILFINGSPNKNGNTVALAQTLLKGKEYETLNLTEYKALIIIYVVKSSIFEGGIQKVLDVFNLSIGQHC